MVAVFLALIRDAQGGQAASPVGTVMTTAYAQSSAPASGRHGTTHHA